MTPFVLVFSVLLACGPAFAPREVCNLADDDGDGEVDEGFDADADGVPACAAIGAPLDCRDTDPDVYPGAVERCDGADTDCDGVIPVEERDLDMDGLRACEGDCDDLDAGAQHLDLDRDGWSSCPTGGVGDCDDFDAAAYPGAVESCDGIDTNCDGLVPLDELDADADGQRGCAGDCADQDATLNRLDLDGDGVTGCDPLPDCDDTDPAVHPSAPELCDGADSDCSGAPGPLEVDADADGQRACAGDCDDSDPERWLGAAELCNGVDDDCDSTVPPTELDGDADGQLACAGDCDDTDPDVATGDADSDGVDACAPTPDCDDRDPSVFPGAPEVCDGADSDCDGLVPVDDEDLDGDGYATCALDCDDADPDVNPGALELCDGRDTDCDGLLLPAEDPPDVDNDGEWACAVDSSGLTTFDCDDGEWTVFTGAPEPCDGVDNDCDGLVDVYTLYLDDDADGFGEAGMGSVTQDCSIPRIGESYCSGGVCWSTKPGDCADFDATRHPLAGEICGDNLDQDCDGVRDDGCP